MNNLVNEILKEIIQNSRIKTEVKEQEGAGERERVLRLPNVFASEISVGQKPDSEERSAFQTWMQHIEGETPDEKIKNVQAFFESDVENYTISETLSHLMFLNAFVYIMKEFNPSVAGFLWEPLLAGLFGGEGGYGKQIPAGAEHDIADIRVYKADGTEVPYSLKVLSGGDVKGSFTDLANHFKERSTEPMIYEIIYKGGESTMEFYKFAITEETVWDILGGFKFSPTLEKEEVQFKLNDPNYARLTSERGFTTLQIRDAKGKRGGGGFAEDWKSIAVAHRVDDDGTPTEFYVKYTPQANNAIALNLRASDAGRIRKGTTFSAEADLTANLATYGEEGEVVAPYKATKKRTPMSKKIWGNDREYAKWQKLYNQLEWQQFWEAVTDDTDGASGYVKTEQFHIPPAQWLKGNKPYAKLIIDSKKVQKVFEKSAGRLGEELTAMFNNLADLTDNIGRFFLSNCGGAQKVQKCSKEDAARRGSAGQTAKQNAEDLKAAVDESVEKAVDESTDIREVEHSINLNKLIEQVIDKNLN